MAPKFGTSGLRGLVDDLTPDLVTHYVDAFLSACDVGNGLFVGRDLRPSSPDLASVVIAAARAAGHNVTDCGALPTPALALASLRANSAAIMVTGSHIPADRNGLKFYLPTGEITKADEAAILGGLNRVKTGTGASKSGASKSGASRSGSLTIDMQAGPDWIARYLTAFGTKALAGLRIGIWSHSAVSRDLLADLAALMGATVIPLGRSEVFIPVDTEAVPDWARRQLVLWAKEHQTDAILSTDGDGDRPLLADAAGNVVPGDTLGQITARSVGADTVVTPITSNTGVERGGHFDRVVRTRIGSPYVIAGMQAAGGRVAGYEANGGFLLGFDAALPDGELPALLTRDSLLPLLGTLVAASRSGGVASLVAAEPQRFTASDRLEDVATEASLRCIDALATDQTAQAKFLAALGETPALADTTDGLRMTCGSGRIVHVRPSGNAPECRAYVEAETQAVADTILARLLPHLATCIAAAT